jgi:hypothetical protein
MQIGHASARRIAVLLIGFRPAHERVESARLITAASTI